MRKLALLFLLLSSICLGASWEEQFESTLGSWSALTSGANSNVCFDGTVVSGSGTCNSPTNSDNTMVSKDGDVSGYASVYRRLGAYDDLDGILVFAYRAHDGGHTTDIQLWDTTPTAQTSSNFLANYLVGVGHRNSGTIDPHFSYITKPGGVKTHWNGTTWTTTASSATGAISTNDYIYAAIEFDLTSGVRIHMLSQPDTSGTSHYQGLIQELVTDWISWSTLNNPSDVYINLGVTFTDLANNYGANVAFMHWYENVTPGWVNGRDSGTPNWDIRPLRCYKDSTGVPVFCVPYDDSTLTLEGSAFTGVNHVKDPTVVLDGSTYYMAASCSDATSGHFEICLASSTNAYGAFTAVSSTPIIAESGTGDHDQIYNPQIFKDEGAVAAERWKLVYSGIDSTGDRYVHYAYASTPSGTWTQDSGNPVLGVGTQTWNDKGVSRIRCKFVGASWTCYTGEQDADGASPVVMSTATGTTLDALARSDSIKFQTESGSDCDTTLSAATTDGRDLTLTSVTGCVVGQMVLVTNDTSQDTFIGPDFISEISGSTIYLMHEHSGETTSGAYIRSMEEWERFEPNHWFVGSDSSTTVWGTCFNQFGSVGGANSYMEQTCVLRDSGSGFVPLHQSTQLPGLVRSDLLTTNPFLRSDENPAFVTTPINTAVGQKFKISGFIGD